MTGDERGPLGPRVLVIQQDVSAPPAKLATAARAAGLDLDIRVIENGDAIPTMTDEAGLVVLGGNADVGDAPDRPHLFEEMNLIRHAAEIEVPVLGICLGGQLAAAALGGEVRRGDSGVEIGWVSVQTSEAGRTDPVTAPIGDEALVFEWHHDIFEPPPGSRLLLAADRYPVQAFRLGSVWGLQPHPEVDPETVLEWCRDPGAQEELRELGLSCDDLLEDAERRSRVASKLLDGWCRVVASRAERPGALEDRDAI